MAIDSSFPEFPYQKTFSSGFDRYRTTSAFTESMFLLNAEDSKDAFFSSANITETGGIEIVAENDVSPSLIQEMTAFWDSNANGILDNGETVLFTYVVKVFVSKDDSYLKQAFEKCSPEADDVCFFLEDNSTDLFSGRSAYIKIGENFRSNLEKIRIISEIELKFKDKYEPFDFTGYDIAELIKTGKISNPSTSMLIGVFQLLNWQSILLAPLYTGLGDLLLTITKGIRDAISIKNTSWDPEAKVKDEAGNESENTEFYPLLLPFGKEILEKLAEKGKDGVKKVTAELKKQLKLQEAITKQNIKKISDIGKYATSGMDGFVAFLEKCAEINSILIEKLISMIEQIVPLFASIGLKWINVVNAFYCGLWNSLIEAILGIVDLVGYLFKGLGALGDAVGNAQSLIPTALEVLDEFIQNFSQIDFSGIASSVFSELVNQLSSINISGWASSLSLEKVTYFLGGLAGFIVQALASIFYSGGVQGVYAALNQFGTMGKTFVDFIVKAVEKAIGVAAGLSVEGITKLISLIMETLKKGAAKVADLIKYIFEALKRGFKSVDEFIRDIMTKFKISYAEVSEAESLGLKFTGMYDEFCSLCKV